MRDEQYLRNEQSRGSWDLYASHRTVVTRLICHALPTAEGRLCVVGAGNCNDLDLATLVSHYREIHLVDIDTSAMNWGIEHQGLGRRQDILVHGDCDISGFTELAEAWRQPSSTDIDQGMKIVGNPPPLPCPLSDVVVSVGLLSQLIECVGTTLGPQHNGLLRLVNATRTGHVRQLAAGTRRGGKIVLITEIVSSDTYPPLPRTHEDELPQLIAKLVAQKNFFTGLNPAVVAYSLRDSSELSSMLGGIQVTRPWLWDFGPRVYACCAFIATRK